MDKEKEFVDALRNGGGYDWLCLNGFELSKDFLINSLKEFIYVTNDGGNHGEVADSIEENCISED